MEALVSTGVGATQAHAAASPATLGVSAAKYAADRPDAAAPTAGASPQPPADPGLYDSRLNDYQLERDSCCERMAN
jgi:hypothetical protein